MTNLVLFGAGASHGPPSIIPSQPPLGSDLYQSLAAMFPHSWGSMPSELETEFIHDFETGMAQLWESGSHAIPNLMQHMAIFFAQYNIEASGTDSYSALLEQLANEGKLANTIFSTLNYECLLEIAASTSGRAVNYKSEYTPSEEALTIWKLHGSCNFLPGEAIKATRGVSYSSGVSMNIGVREVNPSEVAPYLTSNTALYPVMSIYTEGKPVQISRNVIESLQNSWKVAVDSAEAVAVVGVHPNIIDEHIWVPLASTNASVSLIGNDEAINQWIREARGSRPSQYIGSRFQEHIAELVEFL